jgi:polyhydroxybutyrate depolymerase
VIEHLSARVTGVSLAALVLLAACGSGDPASAPTSTSSSVSTSVSPSTSTSASTSTRTTIAPPVDPVGTNRDLTVATPDGRTRTAHLYVPASLPPNESVSLLVALHGGTGTGRQFERTSAFDNLAEANRFLVVYPDGVGRGPAEDQLRTWNGGLCCGAAAKNSVDDVTFLRDLVQQLSAEYHVDPDRVFATGHSNGMIMSYRLVCEAADVFVAAAGQAGTLGVDECNPTAPISFLHIHGSADVNIPIDGGHGQGISGVTFPSPRASIRTLAAADSCPAAARASVDPPATIETWEPCTGGTTIEFVTVSGAMHAWMGAAAPTRAGGPQPFADYDSTTAVWTFLAEHPRA